MRGKTTKIERVFMPEEIASLQAHSEAITAAQIRADGIAATIAGHLWAINKGKLYEIESCKSTAEYAERRFSITKGTVSDAINTFERFGDKETLCIYDRYREYQFSALIRMKKLSDADIEECGITPSMTRDAIMEKIKARDERLALEDKVPDLIKESESLVKALSLVMPKEDIKAQLIHAIPKLKDPSYKPDYETAKLQKEVLEDILNEYEESKAEEQADTDGSYISESSPVEQTDELSYREEPETMPTVNLNLADFFTKDGIDKKKFLAKVWDIVENRVYYSDCDLCIYCAEK